MQIDLLSTNREVLQYHLIEETFGKKLIVLIFNWNSVQFLEVDMDTGGVFFMSGKCKIIRYTLGYDPGSSGSEPKPVD